MKRRGRRAHRAHSRNNVKSGFFALGVLCVLSGEFFFGCFKATEAGPARVRSGPIGIVCRIENGDRTMAEPVRLGVLISGGGRTLQNFLDRSEAGTLAARVVKVISTRADAYGLVRARDHDVPTAVISRKDFDSTEELSEAITQEMAGAQVDLIAMAGFLCLYRIPARYRGRVMNIHPALLPRFGGKDFYGDRVHQAVLDCGCKVSGCTVHFADNEYDHGPIIVQKAVAVQEDDDAHSLADRVFQKELEAYPEAINLFARGRLRVQGRIVRVLPPRP